MSLRLHTYPDPILTRTAPALERFDEDVRERVARMYEIMYESRGVGLAAPQAGWAARLLVLNPAGEREDESGAMVVANPRILKKWGKVVAEEGCLSFPGIFVEVERAAGIRLAWQDEHGEAHEEDLTDFPARIVQHEIDHLDGVLLVHRMKPTDRIQYKAELEELLAQQPAR